MNGHSSTVEPSAHNAWVAGSNPAARTKNQYVPRVWPDRLSEREAFLIRRAFEAGRRYQESISEGVAA